MASGRVWGQLAVVWAVMFWVAAASAQEAQQDRTRSRRDRRSDSVQQTPSDNSANDSAAQDNTARRDRGRSRRGSGGPSFRGNRGPQPADAGSPDAAPDAGGGSRRGRGGPRGPRTPEEREQFYNRIVDHQLERTTREYELNPDQQAQARARLEELKEVHKAYAEPRRQQFESLREQMHRMFEARRNGGEFDEAKARELGEQMRTMWDDSPLMNSDKVTSELEKLLPADQVERGRANRQQEIADWQQRRDEMRQRWEERRQQDQAQGGGPEDGGNDGRRSRRDRRSRGDQGAPSTDPGAADTAVLGERPADDSRGRRQIVEDPIAPWERYVRDFIRTYGLDDSQQATARSMLREAEEGRTRYELSTRRDYEAAHQIADQTERQKRLDELNQPIVRMFDDLKSKLNQIPTTMQRQAAGITAASRPAAATSQPAATAN